MSRLVDVRSGRAGSTRRRLGTDRIPPQSIQQPGGGHVMRSTPITNFNPYAEDESDPQITQITQIPQIQ